MGTYEDRGAQTAHRGLMVHVNVPLVLDDPIISPHACLPVHFITPSMMPFGKEKKKKKTCLFLISARAIMVIIQIH